MPWINKEMCNACKICIENCPVNAVMIKDESAWIDDEKCIRCGICHDVCPQNTVRHDSEKIPEEIQKNLTWVKGLLDHNYYLNSNKKQELVERMKRHFLKEKKVAEKTIEKLDELKIKL